MKRCLLRVLFFPAAALVLGFAWQAVHPEGIWKETAGAVASGDDFPRVRWAEAAERVGAGEWLLVDARPEEQFNAAHIPGALSLPADAYPEFVAFFADEHGTDKTVVIYCGTEDCDYSVELAQRLRAEAGLRDVRILEGGFLGWRRDNAR